MAKHRISRSGTGRDPVRTRPRSEAPLDHPFALRVGALGGRQPEAGRRALAWLKAAPKPAAPLVTDSGGPVRASAIDA